MQNNQNRNHVLFITSKDGRVAPDDGQVVVYWRDYDYSDIYFADGFEEVFSLNSVEYIYQ